MQVQRGSFHWNEDSLSAILPIDSEKKRNLPHGENAKNYPSAFLILLLSLVGISSSWLLQHRSVLRSEMANCREQFYEEAAS
jgi:hypothetical protein